ncbi:hypothetical protein MASR1M107_11090 [Ignavibacteriales bacterium]
MTADIPQEKVIHDQVVNLVRQILDLTEQVNHLKVQSQIDEMKTKINYLEEKVDRIFYDLYGFTSDEIKIIEKKAGSRLNRFGEHSLFNCQIKSV